MENWLRYANPERKLGADVGRGADEGLPFRWTKTRAKRFLRARHSLLERRSSGFLQSFCEKARTKMPASAAIPPFREKPYDRKSQRTKLGESFQLGEVVQIVASHRLDDCLECHGPALGVRDRFTRRMWKRFANEQKIPIA